MINVCKNRMLNFILVNEEAKGEEDELPDDREGQDIGKKSEEITEIQFMP